MQAAPESGAGRAQNGCFVAWQRAAPRAPILSRYVQRFYYDLYVTTHDASCDNSRDMHRYHRGSVSVPAP